MKGYIYLIHDLKENKVYIGKRERSDKYDIESYYGSGLIINNMIKIRGKRFLKKIILGFCYSSEELEKSEIECIDFFKSNDRRYGYNLTEGGDGIKNPSQEVRQKMSISKLGKKQSKEICNKKSLSMMGHKGAIFKHTDEAKEKISEALKKRIRKKETYEKASNKLKGRISPMLGKYHSEETKRKISKSLMGHAVSEKVILIIKNYNEKRKNIA